jgi:Zn-dependent peptidase ImmA (M78 family)
MAERKRRVWRVCNAPDGLRPKDLLAEEKRCRERDAERQKADLKERCSGKSLDEIAADYRVRIKTLPFASWQLDARGRYRRLFDGRQSEVIHLAEDLTQKEREEVLAHELGHYFLRHGELRHRWMVDQAGKREWRPYRRNEPEWETEAEEFGKFLMSLAGKRPTKRVK